MKIIKNFVDNIHNEAYKDSYAAPCMEAGETCFFSYEGFLPGGKKT